MTPDEARKDDVLYEAEGFTFVVSPRDLAFAEPYGGLLVDENRFWGQVVVRPLWSMAGCG